MERAPRLANGEQTTHETFILECSKIYEHMFTVEGVEDCIKKLGMTMGHANPLDSVYKLAAIRMACAGRPASVLTW
eukprot:4051382-Lingulodinium_polyedra.AAC.1